MRLLVEIDDCRFEAEGDEQMVMARYAEWVEMVSGRHPENPGMDTVRVGLRDIVGAEANPGALVS